MTKRNNKNNESANVVNNAKNATRTLLMATGKEYTAAAVDVATAEREHAAAVAAETTAKENFTAVSATYTETKNATRAAALSVAIGHYQNGTASHEELLNIANNICDEHAAAGILAVVERMAALFEDKDIRKAHRAAVADSVSLGSACRCVRENWDKWGKFFELVGVLLPSKAVVPSAFRPHVCNPFAVAVTAAGQMAALPNKSGVLRAVTQWSAEKVASWVLFNSLCGVTFTETQCTERRALMEQISTQYAELNNARAEHRKELAAARRAEKAAAELAENAVTGADLARAADELVAAAGHREKATAARRRVSGTKNAAARAKAVNTTAAELAAAVTTKATRRARRTSKVA